MTTAFSVVLIILATANATALAAIAAAFFRLMRRSDSADDTHDDRLHHLEAFKNFANVEIIYLKRRLEALENADKAADAA